MCTPNFICIAIRADNTVHQQRLVSVAWCFATPCRRRRSPHGRQHPRGALCVTTSCESGRLLADERIGHIPEGGSPSAMSAAGRESGEAAIVLSGSSRKGTPGAVRACIQFTKLTTSSRLFFALVRFEGFVIAMLRSRVPWQQQQGRITAAHDHEGGQHNDTFPDMLGTKAHCESM